MYWYLVKNCWVHVLFCERQSVLWSPSFPGCVYSRCRECRHAELHPWPAPVLHTPPPTDGAASPSTSTSQFFLHWPPGTHKHITSHYTYITSHTLTNQRTILEQWLCEEDQEFMNHSLQVHDFLDCVILVEIATYIINVIITSGPRINVNSDLVFFKSGSIQKWNNVHDIQNEEARSLYYSIKLVLAYKFLRTSDLEYSNPIVFWYP